MEVLTKETNVIRVIATEIKPYIKVIILEIDDFYSSIVYEANCSNQEEVAEISDRYPEDCYFCFKLRM